MQVNFFDEFDSCIINLFCVNSFFRKNKNFILSIFHYKPWKHFYFNYGLFGYKNYRLNIGLGIVSFSIDF